MAALMCAFMSMHLEDEAERKMLGYILKGEANVDIVSKKWGRVPEAHKEWLWGKVETRVQGDPNVTAEQKTRLAEVKKALKI